MPPCQRYPQVPLLAQTGTPKLTFFCKPLLWIISHQEMKIKHLMYMQLCAFRGIPHEGRNSSFEPKSKFLWNHQDSKFLRNSQKILRFQVLHFTDFKIRKWGHGISKFLFDEIEVSPNQNIQQDSVCYMRLTASLMCLQRIACTTSK